MGSKAVMALLGSSQAREELKPEAKASSWAIPVLGTT
jgi:hypothetical protein